MAIVKQDETNWLLGNTRYLTIIFTDNDGVTPVNVDPNSVKFIVYDGDFAVKETINVPEIAKIDVGKYEFTYTPDIAGKFIVEYFGTLAGKPTLDRKKITVAKVF